MIDEASVLKKQVDSLSEEYQCAIDEEISQIDNNSYLSEQTKNHIKRRLKAEEAGISQEKQKHVNPNIQSMCLLINKLSCLGFRMAQKTEVICGRTGQSLGQKKI